MFSKPAFGTTPASTTFGFSSNTATQNPFGQTPSLFGKPATGTFGSTTSTFGNPTPLFGSSTSTPLFQTNTSATFGQNQNQTGFGSTLFGNQQTPSSGTLFGSTTNAFGQQTKPVFGFGSASSSGGIFGQTQPTQQTPFQGSTSGNLFGSTPSFGTTPPMGTVIKFVPVTGTDTMQKSGITTNINTKHHCITCMKEYEGKSFEELRWEDYQANRKGPQQQTGFGVAPFGSAVASSAPSIFGQPSDKAVFGQTGGFGQGTGFGLGNQTSQTGGLFPKPTPTFGTTSAQGSFGFNTTSTANPFAPAGTNPPFGGAASKPPLFGPTSTPSFGINAFGQSAAQPQVTPFATPFTPSAQNLSQTFKSTPFGPFGSTTTTTPTFGQPIGFGQSGSFNFAKPVQPTFGQPSQPGFGTAIGNQTGAPLFGNLQQKPGGFFNPASGGVFTNPNTFQPTAGFNFQLQQQQQQPQHTSNDMQGQDVKSAMVLVDPFGHSNVLTGLNPLKDADKNCAITNDVKVLLDNTVKVKSPSPVKNRMKINIGGNKKMDIFDGALDTNSYDSQNYIKGSGRRLVIRKKSENGKALFEKGLFNIENDDSLQIPTTTTSSEIVGSIPLMKNGLGPEVSNSKSVKDVSEVPKTINIQNGPKFKKSLGAYDLSNGDADDETPICIESSHSVNSLPVPTTKTNHPCGITLTRPDYYTVPPLDELPKYLNEDGTCIVKGFTVGRYDYGNIYFPDTFDVSNLNLDEIVHFRSKEVTVYPDDSKKPPLGQGLNRKAQITLERVWPTSKDKTKLITDPTELAEINFSRRLELLSKKHNSKFKDYRPETGSWVFSVDHFSTYGFTDSDEEEVLEDVQKEMALKKKLEKTDKEKGEEGKGKSQKEDTQKNEAAALLDATDEQIKSTLGIDIDEHIMQSSVPAGLGGFSKDSAAVLKTVETDVTKSLPRLQEGQDEEYESSTSIHPTPLERTPLRPSRTFIYRDIDRSNITLMKSSFFEDEAITIPSGAEIPPEDEIMEVQISIPQPPAPQRKTFEISVHTELLPKQVTLYNPSCVVPSTRSHLASHRNYMDMSIYHGRSFRAGWNRGNMLVCPQTVSSAQFSSPYILHHWKWTELSQDKENPFLETIEEHLRIVQICSRLSVDSMGIPLFTVHQGTNSLFKHQKLMHSILQDDVNFGKMYYYSNIWDLMVAFWSPENHHPSLRRALFSNWLEKVVSNKMEERLYSNSVFSNSTDNTLNRIFTLLTGHRIEEAASFAMQHKMPQLSLLISQLSFNDLSKTLMQEQWLNWNSSGAADHFDNIMLKIYLLMAGLVIQDENNICEGLDWKRALGVHLWYVIPSGAPLTLALKLYKNAFEELNYAARPDPPHNGSNPTNNYDILYHLITLFAQPHKSLDEVLEPVTHTDDPTDFRLSWLLLQTFEALQIGKISDNVKNYLHINFAAQLENIGYWQWAVFALLFLKDISVKKKYVMEILERNVTADLSPEAFEAEGLLVNSFGIPPEWIHIVKAKKAKEAGKNWEAFRHLTLSREWCESYDFAFSKIIPDLVVHNEFDLLENILQIMAPGERSILDWKFGGGLLLDFMKLWKILQDKKPENIPSLALKAVESDFVTMLSRLRKFPLKTNRQALCISECSKCIAYLLKKLYLDLQEKSFINISKASINVESLIMPPDYKQNELIKSLFTMLQIQSL